MGLGRGEGDSPPVLEDKSCNGRGDSIEARLGVSKDGRLVASIDGLRDASTEGRRGASIEGRRGVGEGLEGVSGK